ncbi:MAG TPA: MXAN_2562 family outer membrane beta-barrel protein [Polyangiaceae bacterium]|nr:MXAN_2562 family outer membrane beta-barrel protein [Polyangiaceae bacterium]
MIAPRLRNRKLVRTASFAVAAAASAVAVLAQTAIAKADTHDELGHYERWRRSTESPQDVAVELRFGRYVPNADEGLNGTPYKSTFGDKNRYYVGAEVDWQLLRIPMFGTLGPGIGAGYTIASANARFSDGSAVSKQTTSLAILPMYLVGVLRADVVARETLVPVVPYAKLGLGYALWWSKDQEDTARVDGKVGRGASYGYQFALGAMFLLDVIDRADAKAADAAIGLNHSYIFGEWFKSDLDGFGAKDRLQVGTSTWTVGLAMEF